MKYDAAIIGSGPNGLSAAIALSMSGMKVVVYEAATVAGGGVRSMAMTLPGFVHDPCSAIHPLAHNSPFLTTLPLHEHGLDWIQPPIAVGHPLDDRPPGLLWKDIDKTEEYLNIRYPGWFRSLVQNFDPLLHSAMAPLQLPTHPLLLIKLGLRGILPATITAKLLSKDPTMQAIFSGIAAHSVLPLENSPSAAIGLMLHLAAHAVGWPFPRGGAGQLSAALCRLLESLGGTIITEANIQDLDEIETAGPILFDTSPQGMANIAKDALPERYRSRLNRYRHGPGAFKLDWALSGPIPWRDKPLHQAGTVHLGGSMEDVAAAEQAPWKGEHAKQPFVLLAQQSNFDDSRAPDGQHTGWAYCHVPAGSDTDMTHAIETQVERFAPGFADLILHRTVTRPRDFQSRNPNCIGGDVVGGVTDLRQLFMRPLFQVNPYTTPNSRIFLCSASTPPGGGVHGMCGYFAARAVLRQQNITIASLANPGSPRLQTFE